MKTHSLLGFCFVLLLSVTGLSQETMLDVVYLKNGGIIRGIIIEQVPGKSIKVQTSDGNVFVFNFDEIEKITKESAKGRKERQSINFDGGFRNLPLLGIMSGHGETLLGFSDINGAMLSDDIYVGVGLGYDRYPNGSTLPIFIDFRWFMINAKVRPMFFADVGYSLGWIRDVSGSDNGGFMVNSGIGISIPISNRTAFLAELGYKLQKAKEHYEYYGWYRYSYIENVNYEFFTFRTGFVL